MLFMQLKVLLSFKASGLFWSLRKSAAFFILYPRCADSNPSNTCNKCHLSRALTPSLGSYAYQKQEGNIHLVKTRFRATSATCPGLTLFVLMGDPLFNVS